MTDANNIEDNFERVSGPFGFNYGVKLVRKHKQCLTRNETSNTNDCTHDPKSCPNGFSVGIWEKKLFTMKMFYEYNHHHSFDRHYIFSTGGDDEGHPGVAIFHQGVMLEAIVSTGDRYWKEKVVGVVANNTWYHIGVLWDATDGLKVLINNKTVCFKTHPVVVTSKAGLRPPQTILGCHRDADNPEFRDYTTASLDDLTYWSRPLTGSESILFLGGYQGEAKNMKLSDYNLFLNKSDMDNHNQVTMALIMLQKMLSLPTTTAAHVSDNLTEEETQEQAKKEATNFKAVVSLVDQLTNPTKVAKCLPKKEDVDVALGVTGLLSNLLNEDKKSKWQTYEDGLIVGVGGAMPTLVQGMDYLMEVGRAAGCSKNFSKQYAITKEHAHIDVSKRTLTELHKGGRQYYGLHYTRRSVNGYRWDDKEDKVAVTTELYADPRCQERIINVGVASFRNMKEVLPQPLRLAAGLFNDKSMHTIDSSVLAVKVLADVKMDVENDAPDPRAPRCVPEESMVTIIFTFTHIWKVTPQRQLLFHKDESEIELAKRYCVWWNPALGEWDLMGCTLWYTNSRHTKCRCKQTGFFAVIAEHMEPKVVQEEASWLTIVRYILYAISALCLLFFMLVVAFSGDLKEQFHLMGMCLAAALLVGSVMMVVSDLECVRHSRHSCTAIGTLLHFCYLGAAAWVSMIAHATFKCITSGIVGGRLKQYAFLAAGLTLFSVGVTFTFYIHDLGNDPRCFISWYTEAKGIFFFPLLIFCGVALFCVCVIFLNLHTAALRKNPTTTDYRTFSVGASFLTLYFCLTWIVGVLTYIDLGLNIYFYPYFQILNGLMGVALLLCIGLGSSRFKMVIAGQAKRRREMFLNYTRSKNEAEKRVLDSPTNQPSSRQTSEMGQPWTVSPAAEDQFPENKY